MATASADKDTPNSKLILQICKYNKKAFFPLAISANWLEHPPISKGTLPFLKGLSLSRVKKK